MSESQGGSQYSEQGSRGPGLKLKLKLGVSSMNRPDKPAGGSQSAPVTSQSAYPATSPAPPPVNKIRLKLAKSMAAAAAATAAASAPGPSPAPVPIAQPAAPYVNASQAAAAVLADRQTIPSPPPPHVGATATWRGSSPSGPSQRATDATLLAPRATPAAGAGRLKRPRPVDQPAAADPDNMLEDLEDAEHLVDRAAGSAGHGYAGRPGVPCEIEDDDDDGPRRGRMGRKAARLIEDDDEDDAVPAQAPAVARRAFPIRPATTGAAPAVVTPGDRGSTSPVSADTLGGSVGSGLAANIGRGQAAASGAPIATVPSRLPASAGAYGGGRQLPQPAPMAGKHVGSMSAGGAGAGRGSRSRKPVSQSGVENDRNELSDGASDKDEQDYVLAPEEDDDDDYIDDDDFLDGNARPGGRGGKRRGGFGGGGGRSSRAGRCGGGRSSAGTRSVGD